MKIYIFFVLQLCVCFSFSQELIKITKEDGRNPIVVNLDEFENIFYKNNNNLK